MGHVQYHRADFNQLRHQRNIMVFVGNGFDIQVMSDFGSSVDTRYETFYHFLKLRSFNLANPILGLMEELREKNEQDWSDVEGAVARLLRKKPSEAPSLAEALRELQGEFAEFLDFAVPSSLLSQLGEQSATRKWALTSMENILRDLPSEPYKRSKFPGRSSNFDLYNFTFINFNYTALLDDYVYLDQEQFDPLPFKTVDRNFRFAGNPNEIPNADVRPGDVFFSYITTGPIIHPHGQQSIPRSLLFGVDAPTTVSNNQDPKLRLSKPFWAQNQLRYQHLFQDSELFIIFGCSIGETDGWWWRNIANTVGQEKQYSNDDGDTYIPELIIYWYNGGSAKLSEEEVHAKFLEAADTSISDAQQLIHVVLYDNSDTERVWLNTSH